MDEDNIDDDDEVEHVYDDDDNVKPSGTLTNDSCTINFKAI